MCKSFTLYNYSPERAINTSIGRKALAKRACKKSQVYASELAQRSSFSLANNRSMDVTQLALTWLEGQMVKKLL